MLMVMVLLTKTSFAVERCSQEAEEGTLPLATRVIAIVGRQSVKYHVRTF